MSVIEQELVEASGFEPRRKMDRQDYLAALARAIHETDEADFDKLSEDAQDWFNDAVRAINKKQDMPEFPDAAVEAETKKAVQAVEDDDGDDNEEGSEESDTNDAASTDDDADPEEEPAKAAKPTKAAKPAKAVKAVEPVKAAKKPKKAEEVEEVDAAEEVAEEAAPTKKRGGPIPVGDPDKWGFVIGTKNSLAMNMLEKGCRMGDITEAIGGTYYNAIGRAIKRGHKIERANNGVITLTHVPPKAKAKK